MGVAGHSNGRRRRPAEEAEKPRWRKEPRQGRMGDSGAVTEAERKGIGAVMGVSVARQGVRQFPCVVGDGHGGV